MALWRLAWRNLWRNASRTGITLTSVVISTSSLVVALSLMLGIMDQLVHNVTDLGIGEAQVHAPRYLADRSFYDSIPSPDRILEKARASGIAAAPRSIGVGLLALNTASAGVVIWGVDTASESAIGKLPHHLRAGNFVGAGDHGIVVGRKLARALDASVGSELVAVVQGADGSIGNVLFHVVGILDGISEAVDRGIAIIRREDFDELFSSSNVVHEIAVSSGGTRTPDDVQAIIAAVDPANDVRTWRGLVPMLADLLTLFQSVNWILGGIFFAAAGLGVLNTLLMASYERIPEFGLIKALGATPGRIVREVATEALMLGGLGAFIGGAIGIATAARLQSHGIDLSGVSGSLSMSGITVEPIWKAKVTLGGIVAPVLSMCVVSILASVHPALRAARLKPIEALTHV